MAWQKPWKLTEGFLIVAGLIVVGVMLQLGIGSVQWHRLSWPVNIIVLAFLLFVLALIFLLRNRVYAFRFLSSYGAVVPAILVAAALTVTMGLFRQHSEGAWLNDMLSFWPFVLVYTYIVVILGIVVLWRITHSVCWHHDVPFLLNHLGLFVVIVAATLGNADIRRVRMVAFLDGIPTFVAVDEQQHGVEMPLSIQLKKFTMDLYDDGSPKRFASDVVVYSRESKRKYETTIDVNNPAEVDGWTIYQYGYDSLRGPQSQYSVFELVSDPWLRAVYTGIYMMLAGAGCMFVFGSRRKTV